MSEKSKKERARAWVHSYMAIGIGVVVAAFVPGSTSAALMTMEAHMCYEIGKIYKGQDYTMAEAVRTAAAVGLASIRDRLRISHHCV